MKNPTSTIKWIFLILLLLVSIIVSVGMGAVYISPASVAKVFLSLFQGTGTENSKYLRIILYTRLPRILSAVLVGSALATAGAAIQGLFRNPMASPGILGISSGGSFGALIAIHLGLYAFNIYFLPLTTILGALLSALIIYLLSTKGGRTSLFFLILAGMAVSAFMNGLISLVLLFSREHEVSQFLFWTMGSLESKRWEHVLMAAPPIILGILFLLALSRDLNLFLYGEASAHSMGMDVNRKKSLILLLATIITGTAVSISGTIGFIGLIVPHLIRLILGSDHRQLLPASALVGGTFLLICDTMGRTIMPPFEIRVGIITALLGAPYFISLLIRYQRKGIYGIFK